MKKILKLSSAFATISLLLSACGTAATPAPTAVPPTAAPQPPAKPTDAPAMAKTDVMTKTEVMADKAATDTMAKTDVMTKTEVMADKAMTDTMAKTDVMTKTDAMKSDAMAMPAWQTLELTDVSTGAAFKLADYHGKSVFVELMATWCPNCKKQLGFVTAAKKQLANANIVYVALSVESDLDPAKLAQYSQDTKYDLQFAVLNADGLKAFSDAFGRTALNPPSTPHFIIKPDGTNTKLATGFETADKLVAALKAIK